MAKYPSNQTLRGARELAGFTQQYMANELGVSRQTYVKIEENPARASVLQARRICEILSRSYESIFFGRNVSLTNILENTMQLTTAQQEMCTQIRTNLIKFYRNPDNVKGLAKWIRSKKKGASSAKMQAPIVKKMTEQF